MLNDENKEKLKTELHHFVVTKLRCGHSLHAITQALIIESHKLQDTADLVEAINESNLQP
jgi:hypothetical protein